MTSGNGVHENNVYVSLGCWLVSVVASTVVFLAQDPEIKCRVGEMRTILASPLLSIAYT